MLLFHGGPYQENMLEMVEKVQAGLTTSGAPAESVTLVRNKEGTVRITSQKIDRGSGSTRFLVHNRCLPQSKNETRRNASDQFYQELGVNPLLSTYGQIGDYEALYKSYKYGGFIYRLDSLRRLGIGNIETEGKGMAPGTPSWLSGMFMR